MRLRGDAGTQTPWGVPGRRLGYGFQREAPGSNFFRRLGSGWFHWEESYARQVGGGLLGGLKTKPGRIEPSVCVGDPAREAMRYPGEVCMCGSSSSAAFVRNPCQQSRSREAASPQAQHRAIEILTSIDNREGVFSGRGRTQMCARSGVSEQKVSRLKICSIRAVSASLSFMVAMPYGSEASPKCLAFMRWPVTGTAVCRSDLEGTPLRTWVQHCTQRVHHSKSDLQKSEVFRPEVSSSVQC